MPEQNTAPGDETGLGAVNASTPEHPPVTSTPPSTPWWRNRLKLAAVVAVALLAATSLGLFLSSRDGEDIPTVDLSSVTTAINNGEVQSAELNPAGTTITVTREGGEKQKAYYPSAYADTLTTSLITQDVDTSTTEPAPPGGNILVTFALSMVPMLLFIGVLVWIVKSGAMTGGISAMKNGRGKSLGAIPDARFTDVAGANEAVAEMNDLVDFLAHPARYKAVGATPPRGALLVGPPGTGKTLLARAVAGEAGVPFFPISGADFVETFVGVGARRVRDLFDQAKKAEKAIIFIDEIDAVGRARGQGGGDAERDGTLVAMLNEMDGFHSTGIIVIAATNRAELLDTALTRPGRLDRQIHVPLPDRRGREDILAVHFRNKPADDSVNLIELATRTSGFSGADLARVANDSAILAARDGRNIITSHHISDAVSTIALGRARESAIVTPKDREITAYHESGHTLAALLQHEANDPVEVSITPRGAAGGATWMTGSDDLFMSRTKAKAQLVVALAGREAEKVLLHGNYTSGARGDLRAATELATAMVTEYGMGEKLAAPAPGTEITPRVQEEVDQLLDEAAVSAAVLLAAHNDALSSLSHALLDRGTLSVEQVRSAIGHPGPG
jgi:cell division protease FtsH